MSLLVVVASAAGFLYSISAQIVEKNSIHSLELIQSLIEAQRHWQAASASLDELFLSRQLEGTEPALVSEVTQFEAQISNFQNEKLQFAPQSQGKAEEILTELSANSAEMGNTVEEIIRLANENRWTIAGDVREKVLAAQQTRFNQDLIQLNEVIQLGIQDSLNQALRLQNVIRIASILIVMTALALAITLGIYTTRSIVRPIRELVGVVQRVTLRDFRPIKPLSQTDEIGDLSRSVALMTEWLSDSYETLENRVAERTQDLERQNLQIQVAAEIARDVTTCRDLNELLNRAVELISQRFDFYHAGIFLIDAANEFAELQAASGPTSVEMLASHHKLKVGEKGIVGYVAASGKPRIALDVGVDAVHFQNPLLPYTRSEIAIPLRVANAIIGVLDVQSLEASAFKDDAINVLQILADLLAVAIQNTRLYQDLQENLDELESLYAEDIQSGWRKIIQTGSVVGFQYDGSGVHRLEADQDLLAAQNSHTLSIPLVVRGLEIGSLTVQSANSAFPEEDRTLLEDLSLRISQSLDSARLYSDAQRRAENEKLVNQATSRMLETLEIETVLKSAADEIYRVLDLANITIDLSAREIG
jgi:nitrate/nitrite-specific signal transduction histidine kinase